MEKAGSSETLVHTYKTTLYHNQEGHNKKFYFREDFK
jgi:hypothetical protein